MTAVEVDAPAKLNLWLRIFERDSSGYHRLETLFCALELSDRLRVERGGRGVRLQVQGPQPGPPDQNLAVRAARSFLSAVAATDGAAIELHKRIPVGAGLGGGSSDAAATLLALNAIHDRPLDSIELHRLGAELGSDVPFFLGGSPFAIATGRGERVVPIGTMPVRPVLVAMPPFSIATAEAYAALDRGRRRGAPGHVSTVAPDSETVPSGVRTWGDIARRSSNDFEEILFASHPRLARLRAGLEAAGGAPARLSGSGAALFGVFDSVDVRDEAAALLAAEQPDVTLFTTATRSDLPHV